MSLAQSILFLEASPANLSAVQANSEVCKTTATSGQRLLPLLQQRGPVGSLLKMLATSSQWYSTLYRLTWRCKATKSGRRYFQLAHSMRRTSASVLSSWPTPIANNATGGRGYQADGTPYPHRHTGSTLIDAVGKAWQTPLASDANGTRKADGKRGVGLNTQAMWATPTAHDAKNMSMPPTAALREDLTGDMMRCGQQGYLNPDWVEQLMGLPVGWTDIPTLPSKAKSKPYGKRPAPSRAASPSTHIA